jgi:PAS domain S-box-containing protein
MKDVSLAKSLVEIETASEQVAREERAVIEQLDLVLVRFLGDKSQVMDVRKTFSAWEPIRREVIELSKKGQFVLASEITKGRGAQHVKLLTGKMDGLVKFAQNKASKFLSDARVRHKKSQQFMFGLAFAVLILGGITGFIILLKTNASQKDLLDSKERFENLAEGSLQGILVHRGEVPIYANKTLGEIFGYNSVKEILELRSITELADKTEYERMLGRAKRRTSGEEISALSEFKGVKADGSTIWFESFGRSIQWNGEQVAQATVMDITERKNAEQALEESERRLSLAMSASNAGFWVRNLDEGNVFWSDENYRLLGYEPNEITPGFESFLARIHPEDRNAVSDAFNKLFSEKSSLNIEYRVCLPTGDVRWLQNIGRTARSLEKDSETVAGIQVDISDRKNLEYQVRQSQHLDAIGQLTGGIAHDFNNILGVVIGNLELLQRMLNGNEKALVRVAASLKGAQRGAGLTKKLLAVTGKGKNEGTPVSVNKVVSGMEEMVQKSLTVAIDVEVKLSEDSWKVVLDEGDLEDAILNLTLNSRDAMPNGGRITIETSEAVADSDFVKENPEATEGQYVTLEVKDSGHGMAQDTLDKAQEPFYTTKDKGKGTGLGLSMVHGFVQRSSGFMRIHSELGKGTSVKLFLPRLSEALDQETLVTDEGGVPHGHETVLVVDDERSLSEVSALNLRDLGYIALTADSGAEALEIIKKNQTIDLLFSDVVMPGDLDGYQLAQAAIGFSPTIKILLTSGFTDKKEKMGSEEIPLLTELSKNLLPKPYTRDELATSIRRALDYGDQPG